MKWQEARQAYPNQWLVIEAEDELVEATHLASSPTFPRLVDRGLEQIQRGETRPVEVLLGEL